MKPFARRLLSFVALALAALPLRAAPLEITARFDPEPHRIEASATFEAKGSAAPAFELAAALTVTEIERNGKRVAFEVGPVEGHPELERVTIRPGTTNGAGRYLVRYGGVLHDPPSVAQFSRERIADQTKGTIQPEGIFLAPESAWYPRFGSEPARFRLDVRLPAGWDAVAEGALVAQEQDASGNRIVFETAHPTEGLHLVAGRYTRTVEEHRGIKIATYLFPDDADLSASYLAGVRRYLDLYAEWLGRYPYDRYAVVENFFSTGYGMPGFTVLGGDVLRLPFIVDTSLGHEVAHNWWGNGVFVDESGGNWCEGLTTFVADYRYRAQKGSGEAAEYRREVCRDYTNYAAQAGADFALREFTERTTPATRAVGYGKTMMVFHMLEARLGKERFDAVLRRVFREQLHKQASWSTWREAFSKEAGEDLGWFFEQWVGRPGAPAIAIADVRIVPGSKDGEATVEGTLRTGGEWRLGVPLVLEAEDGRSERRVVETTGPETRVRVNVPFRPALVRVDPDQDVFRKLDPAEIPPVLSKLLGDPKALFVIDDTGDAATTAAYREIADTLTRNGMGAKVEASKVAAADLSARNVFVLGAPSSGAAKEPLGKTPAEAPAQLDQPGSALLAVGAREGDPLHAFAVFRGGSPDAIRAAGRKLVHYGKYSYLVFVDGKNTAKGVARVEGGPLVVGLP